MQTQNGDYVKAKAFGWDEELSPEELLDFEPLEGPIDLEGTLVMWEAAGRNIVTVGGFEADPETVEAITK